MELISKMPGKTLVPFDNTQVLHMLGIMEILCKLDNHLCLNNTIESYMAYEIIK